MNLHQFLSIMRARRSVAALILLVTLAVTWAWIAMRPTYYTARAPVMVDLRSSEVAAGYAPGMIASYMATQIDIVKSARVAERVVQMLQVGQKAEQAQMVRNIQAGLEVKPARESSIINISWTGGSPTEAARVANAFAKAYVDISLELKTEPARRNSSWFEDQVKASRQNLEQAQMRLSQYQQRAGIVGSNEQVDYETARLNELSSQLTTVQGLTTDSQSKRSAPRDTVAEVMQSPLVNGLKADIAKVEARLQESAATLGSGHPQMQRLEAELASLRSRLQGETSRIAASIDTTYQAGKARERELQQSLYAQKSRVMAINKQRDELGLLRRDVESAQRAFEAVSTSASQSRLQSLANQTNLMPLAAAVEPLNAIGPTAAQAMLAAAVAGVLLAVAGALLLELANRRVRSADDLFMATQLPILGSVPAAASVFAIPRLASSQRRLAIGHARSSA